MAANATCVALAELLDCDAAQILPFSTGVILEPLPVDRIQAGLPQALKNLQADTWFNAAEAIMTTDTQPKAASRSLVEIRRQDGHADRHQQGRRHDQAEHGDDAGFSGDRCRRSRSFRCWTRLVKVSAADKSFNCITIDGDTSTNDSFMLIATGASGELDVTCADSA